MLGLSGRANCRPVYLLGPVACIQELVLSTSDAKSASASLHCPRQSPLSSLAATPPQYQLGQESSRGCLDLV